LNVYFYINKCYFLQGGIKAVIWTDVFQCIILFMGIFAILIQVSMCKAFKIQCMQICPTAPSSIIRQDGHHRNH